MSGSIDEYVRRLRRELRSRGLNDARIVAEAREHLLDTVTEGRERGLSVEDAEREALDRFGSPQIVATHAQEQDHIMHRLAAAFDTVWRQKWWILAPTVLTAVVTSVMSYYFLPTRYRSESIVGIVPPRVPAEYVRATSDDGSAARLQELRQVVLNTTRLERLIKEFRLYQVEQQSTPLSDLVLQMRRDINLEYFTSDPAQDDDLGAVRVSFVSADPNAAAKVTKQLVSVLVKENLQEREIRADSISQFIQASIADVQRRLLDYEKTLEELRLKDGGRPLSPAYLLPYEVLQQRYRELLSKGEEARTAVNLERRQIGESFKILEFPQVPERPVGPSRLSVNLAGTFAGLGVGVVLLRKRRRPIDTSD